MERESIKIQGGAMDEQGPQRGWGGGRKERRGHDPQSTVGDTWGRREELRHKGGSRPERGVMEGALIQQSDKETARGLSPVFKDP